MQEEKKECSRANKELSYTIRVMWTEYQINEWKVKQNPCSYKRLYKWRLTADWRSWIINSFRAYYILLSKHAHYN